MFEQMTLWDTDDAISSPGSAYGTTRSGLLDGRTMRRSGQGRARASRSRPLANERGSTTSDTSGPSGFVSSRSADLQSSLVSKLQARMAMLGSTLFKLTWKQQVMPSGRLASQASRQSASHQRRPGASGSPHQRHSPVAAGPAGIRCARISACSRSMRSWARSISSAMGNA